MQKEESLCGSIFASYFWLCSTNAIKILEDSKEEGNLIVEVYDTKNVNVAALYIAT